MAKARFNVGTLKSLAGPKVFARGGEYHAAGAVTLLRVSAKRVTAEVAGASQYRCELSGENRDIDGECSCPAFEDHGFCKHLVATALTVNALKDGANVEDPIDRIRAYLKSKSVDALADILLELADRDPALFRRFDAASAGASGDATSIEKRIGKALRDATRVNDFIDYRNASDWATGVDGVLDVMAELPGAGHAAVAARLAWTAHDLLERARDIHLAAVRAARPDPVQLAAALFHRELGEGHGCYYQAADLYADVLGEAGAAEYRRLAAEAWNKLLPLVGPRQRDAEFDRKRSRLSTILDAFAERDGDIDARIALRAKTLDSTWAFRDLAEFCLKHGRREEALRRAEEGAWLFEDERTDESLLEFLVKLLAAEGRKDDVLKHLRRAFDRDPSETLYRQLKKHGGADEAKRAVAALEAKIASAKPSRWGHPADLLARILTAEKAFDAGWALVVAGNVAVDTQERLARASERSYPANAVKVYARRVEGLLGGGHVPSYPEAAELIARIAGLHSPAEHTAYVIGVKQRHGRRKRFMEIVKW
jgi:uncharacterized Zn finger protein